MRIPKTDLGLLGVALAVTMFLAQGPYDKTWKYVLAFSPFPVAVVVIIGYRVFIRGRNFVRALLHAKNAYDLVTATDIKSTFTVRVLNNEGDLLYERYFFVRLTKNGTTIQKTKRDLVSSEVSLQDFPPPAKVKNSKPRNVQLTPRDVTSLKQVRAGRSHFDNWWSYEISPPLRNKGDFVEYSYSAVIPKCEATAFSEGGSLFFFHHESLPLDVHYSLIAPPRHRIVVMDSWSEDSDGQRSELSNSERPQLDDNQQVLTWKPNYRKGECFICKYRLVAL